MEAVFEQLDLPPLDEDGLILNPKDWNESIAEEMAQVVGIKTLSQDHWLVINALRDY